MYILQEMCTLYIDIDCMCTLYSDIVCMYSDTLYAVYEISDTVLILHSDTVYGEHSVTIHCGTVSVLYIAAL